MTPSMTFPVVSLLVTVALAFLGYGATYLNNLAVARRRERLELVTRQLNNFYGPLYVASRASEMAFNAFLLKMGRNASNILDPNAPHDTPLLKEWRRWVKEVLMPLNRVQEDVILKNAHLLREAEMPESLLRFVAHVAAYKAVLAKWEEGDYSDHLSIIDYPTDLVRYASESYSELKQEQLLLIGKGAA